MSNYNNNTNNNNCLDAQATKPYTTRWPGLEFMRKITDNEFMTISTRQHQINLEVSEAAARELEYADLDIDLNKLKFSTEPGEKHTTIDFVEVNDESQRARITTNDHVIYTRIKKLIAESEKKNGGTPTWLIEDLKFNRTKSAVFFITVTCPIAEAKRIFSKGL